MDLPRDPFISEKPPMSAEALTALRGVTWWRTLGIVVGTPGVVLRAIGTLFVALGAISDALANACYAHEMHHARTYENVTNVPLGPMIGQGGRYNFIHPGQHEAAQQRQR